jgi:hypothetical protein
MTMDARLDPIDMNPQRVAFFVRGRPQPAGSKRAFPIRRKEGGGWIATGKVAVVDDNPKAKGWQAEVAYADVRPRVDECLRPMDERRTCLLPRMPSMRPLRPRSAGA